VAIHADGLWEVPRGSLGDGLPWSAADWFSGSGSSLDVALELLLAGGTDAVFVALHGPMGEDGTVQGLLEMAGLPYTGPEVTAAAVAMDKRLTKELLRAAGIPTPRYFPVGPGTARATGGIDWEAVLEQGRRSFGFPWVLKPNRLGSSVGVAIVRDAAEFREAARASERHLPWARPGGAVERGGSLLVEEFVEGRELTCGVLALGGAARALPPIEIRPVSRPFFDYQAKYTPGASEEICPAPLDAAMTARVEGLAVAVHSALGCDPLSRTDFILDRGGTPQVLEINTIPGMTATSLIPLACRSAGLDLGDVFRGLVEHALRRAGRAD
jgi:D-alanine-D-alanine ligase